MLAACQTTVVPLTLALDRKDTLPILERKITGKQMEELPSTPNAQRRIIFPSLYERSPTGASASNNMDCKPTTPLHQPAEAVQKKSSNVSDSVCVPTSLRQPASLNAIMLLPPLSLTVPRTTPNAKRFKNQVSTPQKQEQRTPVVLPRLPEKKPPRLDSPEQKVRFAGLPDTEVKRKRKYRPAEASLVFQQEKSPKPVRSILRSATYPRSFHSMESLPGTNDVTKSISVESDIPSLASTLSQVSLEGTPPPPVPCRRAVSEPIKKIIFDPRVWVREFKRSEDECQTLWYSSQELEAFRIEAFQRIMAYTQTELIPTGTGRAVQRRVTAPKKIVFSHRALCFRDEGEIDSTPAPKSLVDAVAAAEIQHILIVDPHDICHKLFTKAFKVVLPHVNVVTAVTSEAALRRVAEQRFDVIIVEERLKLFHRQQHQQQARANEPVGGEYHASGTALLHRIAQLSNKALYIGVSARIEEDRDKLINGGADICWSKPPPPLNESLRNEMLKILLQKRGKHHVADQLFKGV